MCSHEVKFVFLALATLFMQRKDSNDATIARLSFTDKTLESSTALYSIAF